MMQATHKVRINLSPDAFSIDGDKALFDKIVADQDEYAGKLRPSSNWDKEIDGHIFESFSSLQQMLDPLIGNNGLKNISAEIVREYHSFLKKIDHLNILPSYFDENGDIKPQAEELLVTDLGSIIDVNIVSSYLHPDVEEYNILEVGGGYGRLAEAFFSVHGNKKIKYILVDAVPASIMYSYLYLSRHFEYLKIGFYYNGDPFDMNLFDCYIMPAWHFDFSGYADSFDCCINVQSMQEMNQYHVDYYLGKFNKLLKDRTGIAYISNEKDYVFKGRWNYPDNWELIFKTRTPRSWTRNSPTEVFRKGKKRDVETYLLDFMYSLQLIEFDQKTKQSEVITSLWKRNQDYQQVLEESQQENAKLNAGLQESQQENAKLNAGLQESQQENARLNAELQQSEQENARLQAELQQNRKKVEHLNTILSRTPLAFNAPTLEQTEQSIQNLKQYYTLEEYSDVVALFEKSSKINAHLLAANLCLRGGAYRKRALWHLLQVAKMDPLILFSVQIMKVLINGLFFQLVNRNSKERMQ